MKSEEVGIVLPHLVHSPIKLKMQSKFWSLTLNNPTEDEIRQWCEAVDKGHAKYLCYQKEVAPTSGTLHLQGYVVTEKRIRLTGLKKFLGRRIHAVRSNGTPSSNREYCSKSETAQPGTFQEFGTIPDDPQRGKRSDFDLFKDAVEEGLRCKKKAREEFPELVAKYPRWCYDILADQKDISIEDHSLHDWQKHLEESLSEEADDRKVVFVVDKAGGQGKTWFGKWYCKNHVDAQYMEPAKKADMAYALQDNLRVLFLNVTRTTDSKNQEYLYSFVESVKDGMVFSPKYESRTKYFEKVHVVVMMNQDPNLELLSEDRYVLIELK